MTMINGEIRGRDEELYRLFLFYKQMIDFLDTFFNSYWSELQSTELVLPYNKLYIRICDRIDELISRLRLQHEMHLLKWRPYENLLGLWPEAQVVWELDRRSKYSNILGGIHGHFVSAGGKECSLDKNDETFLGEIQSVIETMKSDRTQRLKEKPQKRKRKVRPKKRRANYKKKREIRSMEKFPTPPDAAWNEVYITFKHGHAVSIKVRDEKGIYDFTQMGMASRQNRNPTVQWNLLRAFADHRGTLTWDDSEADRRNQKRKERLSKTLRAFFGIRAEPFRLLKNNEGWETCFHILPD